MSINTQELAKLVGLKPELLQGIRELSAISSQVDAPPLDAIKLASIQNTVVSLFGDTASNNGLKKC